MHSYSYPVVPPCRSPLLRLCVMWTSVAPLVWIQDGVAAHPIAPQSTVHFVRLWDSGFEGQLSTEQATVQ